jgi:lambda family phage portal protein
MSKFKPTKWDRFTASFAPQWTEKRMRVRALMDGLASRNYEAAAPGRRTSGWARESGDANASILKSAAELRKHARDLERNNAWARRALSIIANNTVSWGILPKPAAAANKEKATQIWNAWADSTDCDAAGRLTFYGIQRLAVASVARDGEVFLRRRWRKAEEDGLDLPMQVQVLEADYLDSAKEGRTATGVIVQGIEFDLIGRRLAYWMFPNHPGASSNTSNKTTSYRVPASEVIHVFRAERPGQVRGVSWMAPVILALKDFDEWEDATLMRQKIAAMFSAFVSDPNGEKLALGEESATEDLVEGLEPGTVSYLEPGEQVSFSNPPQILDGEFSRRELHRVAAGLGVPYEALTGDYSSQNFSSAKMSRISHQANVEDWQWNMLIPTLCDGVWQWVFEAANAAGLMKDMPGVRWTTPPLPMLEPDKEGLAYMRLVRTGVMTPSQMVRERGGDPDEHWAEYAADLKTLDGYGIKLDADVRATSQAGQVQQQPSASGDIGQNSAPAQEKRNEVDEFAERTFLDAAHRFFEGSKK